VLASREGPQSRERFLFQPQVRMEGIFAWSRDSCPSRVKTHGAIHPLMTNVHGCGLPADMGVTLHTNLDTFRLQDFTSFH